MDGQRKEENGNVQKGIQWAAAVIVLIMTCTAGAAQYQGREEQAVPGTSSSAPPPEDRIDINHASERELLKVPGMTPTWARRIVRFRPYHSKVDLLDRGVVSAAVYGRIKDYVIAHRN